MNTHKHNFRIGYDPNGVFLDCAECDLVWVGTEIIELIETLMSDVEKMSGLWWAHRTEGNVQEYVITHSDGMGDEWKVVGIEK